MTLINFKVVICKAIEFFYYHCNSLSNDGAKLHTFINVDKYFFATEKNTSAINKRRARPAKQVGPSNSQAIPNYSELYEGEKVSPWVMSPVVRPFLSQRTRWAEVP